MPVLTGVNPGVVSPSSGEHPRTPTHAKKNSGPNREVKIKKKNKEKNIKKREKGGSYLSESSIARYIDANEPIREKLLFLSPIRSRKGAYQLKTSLAIDSDIKR